VTGITVTAAGSGYPVSSSTITTYVEPANGIGTGYTTTATSNSSGQITAVATGSGGSGFTESPTVWIMPTGVTYPWYMGTAYTVNGVQRTLYLDYPEWLDYGQQSNYIQLAQQKLNCVMNTVVEGGLTYFGKQATFFTLGQAVNIAGATYTTGYESIAAPARSVTLDFMPDSGGVEWITRINFSTRMKPFTGDRLYAHPNYLAMRSNPGGGASNIAAGFSGSAFRGTDFSGGIGGAMASAGDMGAMPMDSGVQMPSQRPRPVGVAEAERENQRNRRDGPAKSLPQPFDEVNPSNADIAEARRRQRADRRREGDDES
jgi:hypothetical protein